MSGPYNGYSWGQRMRMLRAFQRLESSGEHDQIAYLRSGGPCEVCGDPEVTGIGWHAEDYSEPFRFRPPAAFIVCNTCHQRIHKRFDRPWEWRLFLEHVDAGGFGREFANPDNLAQRRAWEAALWEGRGISMPTIRRRHRTGREWWRRLTLDPESLDAAWARPRPLRQRPGVHALTTALGRARPSRKEWKLLRAHAEAPRRCATMRQLSRQTLPTGAARGANLVYGRLARRIAEQLAWNVDRRADGTPIWMSAVAEGWQPLGREYEWVMIPNLASALRRLG